MKMLEKMPEDRYASAVELCAVLGSAMADAEEDASWDLPLFDPAAPDTKTTEEEPSMVDANEDEATRMMRKWVNAQPRRGRKPTKGAEPAPKEAAPNQDDIPTVAAEPNPDDISTVEASPKEADALPVNVPEALAAALTRAFPHLVKEGLPSSPENDEHDQEREALEAPAPCEAPRVTPTPRPPVSRRRSRLLGAAGLAVVVLGAILFAESQSPPESGPLHTSSEVTPTQQAGPGHEVALTAKPLDPPGGEGAEPATMGSISAPVMITMLRKDDSSEKAQEKKTKVLGRAAKALGTAAVCTALSGCPAPQVRPTPEPAPCPASAVETMKTLGLDIGNQHPATFPSPGASYITVREGDTTLSLIGDWGKLPQKTLLSGRLIFGDGRVYGRLTEAKVPGGDTFKVCLEVRDEEGGRGAIREPDGGQESARIFSTVDVRAVSSFE